MSDRTSTYRIHYAAGLGPDGKDTEDVPGVVSHTEPRPGEKAEWFIFYGWGDDGRASPILTIPAHVVTRIEKLP